jgi:hypothetical protein
MVLFNELADVLETRCLFAIREKRGGVAVVPPDQSLMAYEAVRDSLDSSRLESEDLAGLHQEGVRIVSPKVHKIVLREPVSPVGRLHRSRSAHHTVGELDD